MFAACGGDSESCTTVGCESTGTQTLPTQPGGGSGGASPVSTPGGGSFLDPNETAGGSTGLGEG